MVEVDPLSSPSYVARLWPSGRLRRISCGNESISLMTGRVVFHGVISTSRPYYVLIDYSQTTCCLFDLCRQTLAPTCFSGSNETPFSPSVPAPACLLAVACGLIGRTFRWADQVAHADAVQRAGPDPEVQVRGPISRHRHSRGRIESRLQVRPSLVLRAFYFLSFLFLLLAAGMLFAVYLSYIGEHRHGYAFRKGNDAHSNIANSRTSTPYSTTMSTHCTSSRRLFFVTEPQR